MHYSVLQIPWNFHSMKTDPASSFSWVTQTFPGMLEGIPRNIWQHSSKHVRAFPGMLDNIPQNVWLHSRECMAAFPGMFSNIPEMFGDFLWNVWQHSPRSPYCVPHSRIPGFIHSLIGSNGFSYICGKAINHALTATRTLQPVIILTL